MRKILLLLSFITLLNLILANKVCAADVAFGSHDKVIKIFDLPNTEDYTSSDGKLFDFGYKYTLFEVANLPLFQKGEGKIVGYIDDDNYVVLSDGDIQNIVKTNEVPNLNGLVKIPFWDVWGGKITGSGLAFLLVFGIVRNRK